VDVPLPLILMILAVLCVVYALNRKK